MKKYPSFSPAAGFTLIEISIVVVIIGLLAGGILVGRDLIREAHLAKITRDIGAYKAAYYTFREKYNAIPGDIVNPGALWASLVGQTGDGNKRIDNWSVEQELAWKELIEAGLVKVTLPAATYNLVFDIPLHSEGAYYWGTDDPYEEIPRLWSNTLSLARRNNQGASDEMYLLFSAGDAQRIDRKIDDGFPLMGKIQGLGGIDANGDGAVDGPGVCSINAASSVVYNTMDGSEVIRCRLVYFIE